MADRSLLPVPPAQQHGARHEGGRDQEESRQGGTLADGKRPVELMFGQGAEDQAGGAGRHRHVSIGVTP